jgi:O-antigen ligase
MNVARLPGPAPETFALGGLIAFLVVAGAVLGPESPSSYFAVVVALLVALTFWRPVWSLAGLLTVVLLADQYGEILAEGIGTPFLLSVFPLFENLRDFTALSFVYANAVELWLLLLALVWFLRGVQRGSLNLHPVACPAAWYLALVTFAATFVIGILTGGDPKIALWEVRGLGYLFGFSWLVPQLLERRGDLQVVLWAFTVGLGGRAIQGLFRYFVILRMQIDLESTFLAHEDPVMFIPLLFLLVTLLHYRAAPRLSRALLVAVPIMLVALVLTQRRIAYVSLPICAAIFFVQLGPQARRSFARFAVPMLALGALYVVLFIGSSSPLGRPIDRALMLFDTSNPSNLYRLVEQDNLRHTIKGHPWGIGFGHPFEIVRDLPKVWVFWNYIPHNEILWVWVKAGTVGFILAMFFFARVIAESTWAHRRLQDPLLRAVAPVIGLAVANQLLVSYYELQLTYARNMIYLGTFVGLLATIERWGGLLPASGSRQRWA